MSDCDLGICKCYPPHATLTPEQREAIGQAFDDLITREGMPRD